MADILRMPQAAKPMAWWHRAAHDLRRANPHWLNRAFGAVRTQKLLQYARVRLGRALDRIRRDNVILLCTARSGSTLLVDYLSCHPQVRCRGEILGEGPQGYGVPYSMQRDRLLLHVESYFVKPPGMMAGAKILTFHLDELPIDAYDLVELLNMPKVVVLHRRNLLEQYVSLKMAERDGQWHKHRPVKNTPIWIDPAQFVAYSERERRMWQESLAGFGGCNQRFISYESLTTMPEETMRGVFDFLDLEPCSIQSLLVRVRPHALADKVQNYAQFLRPEVYAHVILEWPGEQLAPRLRAA